MNIENELKLIPTKDVTNEQIMEVLRKYGFDIPKEGKIVHQEDTYFDDEKGSLEKSGGSFRIRRKKDKVQITCKIPVASNTEYKQRKEYEITVPEKLLQDKQTISLETAVQLLKEEYPELELPENMSEILTVINDRNKTNLICTDGTVIEMAMDTLQGKDGNGQIYSIKPEIEFETKSGKPENLSRVWNVINSEFLGQFQRNTLSKYARTKKEIQEQKPNLSSNELALCALLSQALNSTQFQKLRYKGQILHRYDKETLPEIDKFKDFNYLVNAVSRVKNGEYKLAIPKSMKRKKNLSEMLRNENYEFKNDITLEDMFCLLLSDVNYSIADEALARFLNKEYFAKDLATTNRLSHSQQVMLATGLACKSSQVKTTLEERMTCMVSALLHDIGHVPLSHTMEKVIDDEEGLFSHEINGKRVINSIYEQNKETMLEQMGRYSNDSSTTQIEQALKMKKNEIGRAIEEHSRTNSETRGIGPNVQIPRACDKICYVVSDICDLNKYFESVGKGNLDILAEDWVEEAIKKICGENTYLYGDVNKMLHSDYINFMRKGEYGRALVNTINSISTVRHDGHDYYDVKQEMWNFMLELINKTKDARKEIGMEQDKHKVEQMARFLLAKITNQYLREFKGDKEKAKWAAIDYITCMDEKDLINYARSITIVSDEQLEGKTPITPLEMEALKKSFHKRLVESYIASGMNKKQAIQEANQRWKEVKDLPEKEMIQIYSKLSVLGKEEMKNVSSIRKMEDTQLKVIPSANMKIEDILTALNASRGESISKIIYDQYYSTNVEGRSVRVRKTEGSDIQTITVKEEVPKNVRELSRKKYESRVDSNLTIGEMLEIINRENPGLNAQVESEIPIKELKTRRTEYVRSIKGTEVTFSNDDVMEADGRTFQEIEIKCPESTKTIRYLKERLKAIFGNKFRTTKDSKIDRATKKATPKNGKRESSGER